MKMMCALVVAGCLAVGSVSVGTAEEDASRKGPGGRAKRAEQKAETKEHFKKQHAENKEFRKGMKEEGQKGDEKAAAIKEHRATQRQENKEFIQKRHEENMTYLKERLANTTKITDTQKEEISAFFEQQYQENVSFRDAQHAENVTFFESIANNDQMTTEQKKDAIRERFKQQKKENKEHRQTQREERKDEKQQIRSEVKENAASGGQTE